MFGKRKPPPRIPHPDPSKELQLQRILDLRASIYRRSALIEQYRSEISKLLRSVRDSGSTSRMEIYRAEIKVLDSRISAAEDAITKTGEEIARLQALIDPDDLAFL